MNKKIILSFIASFSLTAFIHSSDQTGSVLRELTLENLKVTEREDIGAVLSTFHSQSPTYLLTKQQMLPLFENFDLKHELLNFKYIGRDGDYAVARLKQSTKKVSGLAFRNNEIDMVMVYRKEAEKWKFWNLVILELKYID